MKTSFYVQIDILARRHYGTDDAEIVKPQTKSGFLTSCHKMQHHKVIGKMTLHNHHHHTNQYSNHGFVCATLITLKIRTQCAFCALSKAPTAFGQLWLTSSYFMGILKRWSQKLLVLVYMWSKPSPSFCNIFAILLDICLLGHLKGFLSEGHPPPSLLLRSPLFEQIFT